ncbi:MAG: hypothetical protein DRI01_04330 [Chloroflexi bacterium]|nr:MAG: hypothetical protein DRI01_04330 [Chloroflexota bacterium]
MIIAAVIVLLAGFVRAISGFGFALIATPLLLFVLDPKSVVVINIILGILTGVLLLLHTRRHIDVKRMLLMCVGSVFGIPIGAYLLSSLDSSIIKLVIAILIVPFCIVLLLGHSHQFKRDHLGCGISGFISGLIGSSTSFSGPPVALFLLNQGLVKERFIGTLTAYFLFMGAASVSAFSFMGMVTIDLLIKVAILLPTAILGFYIGIKVSPRIDTTLFRRIVVSIVSLAALVIIVTFLLESI